MVRLAFVLFVALCLAAHADSWDVELNGNGIYQTSDHSKAKSKTESLKRSWELGGRIRIADDVDLAMGQLFKIAILNLRHKGFQEDADRISEGWKKFKGTVPRMAREVSSRKIGDWEPLSMWLSFAYALLEDRLGYSFCHASHLDAIMVFNYTIPVVLLKPCEFPEQEFSIHFCGDTPDTINQRRGLLPETSYFLAQIGCSIATFGAGAVFFFICGPIATLVEVGVEKWVAPYLSGKIYNWACN